MNIKLQKNEYEYLCNFKFLNKEIIDQMTLRGSYNVIDLDEDTIDRIQELLVEKLLEVGFDAEYDLTPEGCIIESLVDKFNI